MDHDWVEMHWSVMGDRLHADHNYRLYSALVEDNPVLKTIDWQLGTITGVPDKGGWIKLGRRSQLMIRCQMQDINNFDLANKMLRIGQSFVLLGEIAIAPIEPKESLSCRLTIIKLEEGTRVDLFQFGCALGKQLNALGVGTLPTEIGRGAIQVKGDLVVGYGVKFERLKPDESIKLQVAGLGGKRKMGCGVFIDVNDKEARKTPRILATSTVVAKGAVGSKAADV